MISRRTGAAFSRSRQVTMYRRMGRDLEVLSTWALQLCTTRPAPDRAVSGRSISCSASKRSATILSSSTEVPVIELSSPATPHQARGTRSYRAAAYLPIPLSSTAHNSSPAEGVDAAKYRNGPEVVNSPGSEPTAPGSRFMSRLVFAFVPLLFHISVPCTPSSAVKSSLPLYVVKSLASEPALPGLMSLTSLVPFLVPSLFHNSTPRLPSFAQKWSLLRNATSSEISEASAAE